MKARNPWQELLVKHINHLSAPPRPEGYLTRYEIADIWKKSASYTHRALRNLLEKKQIEMIKHTFVIQTKNKPALRKIQLYKIPPTKHPHK
jgi:hypothetical protein